MLMADYGLSSVIWIGALWYWWLESDEAKIKRHNEYMPPRIVPGGWTAPDNWKHSQYKADGTPKIDTLWDKWDGTDGYKSDPLIPNLYQVNKKYYKKYGENPIGYDRDTRKTFQELGFND